MGDHSLCSHLRGPTWCLYRCMNVPSSWFFSWGTALGNNSVWAWMVLKGSEDDDGVDSNMFGGRDSMSRLWMPLCCLSLFLTQLC